ncbi:MAG TPA: CocE/NonD family hydrolase [Patescibacteria group bacterium]|nr:CocE/NonD family hydrolase [Patescibacteria group bacterium]
MIPQPQQSVPKVKPFEIEVRTRRNILIRADVYLPPEGGGRYPVLFAASPYQKELRALPAHWHFPFVETGPIDFYLDRGYAYVWADVAGSGRSEGEWDPCSRTEGEDLYDVIEWLAIQKWCTGKIGMIGQSYLCWSQWNAARTRPPHLTTIAAYDGAVDPYRDWMYQGGMPAFMFPLIWLVGSISLQHLAAGHDIYGGNRYRFLYDVYSHPFDDEWFRKRASFWELDQVDIPVFSIGVWGKRELHLRGNILGYERVRGPKQLLVTHPDSWARAQALFADPEFHERELLPWYEHHLKGVDNGVMERPPVRYYVEGGGKYRSAKTWPPEDAEPTAFYLTGARSGAVKSLNDGSLAEDEPSAREDQTSWSYPDPLWVDGTTAYDENGVPDAVGRMVTYTTPPFERDREFSGEGVLEMYASTDQTDLDLTVRLNVIGAGPGMMRRRKVSCGWLRASHRAEDPKLTKPLRPFHSHQKAEPIEPGRPYPLRLELRPMSFLVRKGERLMLIISNDDSMILDGVTTHWYGQKVGTDTYHHDSAHPSRLVLHERPPA